MTEKRWTELEALCPESGEWPSMHIDWEDGTDPRYIDFIEEAPKAVPELIDEVRRLQKIKESVRVARRVQATLLNPIWQEIDRLLAEEEFHD